MLADMVSSGNRLVDVGCDHGFLSIYLVQTGICPGALAMDVRKGPLAAAKTHVEEAGLGGYIETRLSDGLQACEMGEADTLVCAGMGGPLMEKILRDSMDKVSSLKELILQPQSEIKEFREFLREIGFSVVDEDAVIDEGKYYFAMKVIPRQVQGNFENADGQAVNRTQACVRTQEVCASLRLYNTYGEFLLKRKHPVLLDYLTQRREYIEKLQKSLEDAVSEKAKERLAEVQEELVELSEALAYFR